MAMVIQFNDYDRERGAPDCLEDKYINGFQRILTLWDGNNSDTHFSKAPEIRALSMKMIELLENAKKYPQITLIAQTVAVNAMMAIETYAIGICAVTTAENVVDTNRN
ncbi:hypothetical protein ROS1_57240 [Roseibium sp. ROS1]